MTEKNGMQHFSNETISIGNQIFIDQERSQQQNG